MFELIRLGVGVFVGTLGGLALAKYLGCYPEAPVTAEQAAMIAEVCKQPV